MRRRTFLGGVGAAGAWLAFPSLARATVAPDARLCFVILRGGLDGLGAVPAVGDRSWSDVRGEDGEPARPGQDGPIALDDTFALHGRLAALRPLWDARELAIVHAVGLPYQQRSHFDAQDVLENGTARPFGAPSGWLGRALAAGSGWTLGAGRAVPLVLRGDGRATSVDPDHPPKVDAALRRTAAELWANDPLFAPALAEAERTETFVGPLRNASPLGAQVFGPPPDDEPRPKEFSRPERGNGGGAKLVGAALAAPDGPTAAVLELGGWDTHTAQDTTLAARLPELAQVLLDLRTGLGDAWARTIVVAATEFGRTVHPNGSGGTDHGVGGAAFLAGGRVDGGRVIADWPGLRDTDLLDGRDLRPTTDLRAVLKGVLRDHLGLDPAHLDREVFPDSGAARALDGLVRA